MAAPTPVAKESGAYTATSSKDTTLSFTPQHGDLIFCAVESATESMGISTNGKGWARIGGLFSPGGNYVWGLFENLEDSDGVADNVSISSSGTFTSHTILIVRPPTGHKRIAWNTWQDEETTSRGDLPATLHVTEDSPDLLVAFGGTADNQTFTTDTGWTALDSISPAGEASLVCEYRESDDTEWICDVSGSGQPICLFVVEFVDATRPQVVSFNEMDGTRNSPPSGTVFLGETVDYILVILSAANFDITTVVTDVTIDGVSMSNVAGANNGGSIGISVWEMDDVYTGSFDVAVTTSGSGSDSPLGMTIIGYKNAASTVVSSDTAIGTGSSVSGLSVGAGDASTVQYGFVAIDTTFNFDNMTPGGGEAYVERYNYSFDGTNAVVMLPVVQKGALGTINPSWGSSQPYAAVTVMLDYELYVAPSSGIIGSLVSGFGRGTGPISPAVSGPGRLLQ